MKAKKALKRILLILFIIIIIFIVGIWLTARIVERNEMKKYDCDEPVYLSCILENIDKKITCQTDDDCYGRNVDEQCAPGQPGYVWCPAKYFCGEDGYCKFCTRCEDN